MTYHDVEYKNPDNELGKKQYDAAMDGTGNNGKGLHMYARPYLWRKSNLVIPFIDTPCENFVPTPTINAGEEVSLTKKAIKIGLLVAFIAFVIYAFVAILLENPAHFELGEVSIDKLFRLQLG